MDLQEIMQCIHLLQTPHLCCSARDELAVARETFPAAETRTCNKCSEDRARETAERSVIETGAESRPAKLKRAHQTGEARRKSASRNRFTRCSISASRSTLLRAFSPLSHGF